MDKLFKLIIGIFLVSVVISFAETALAISKEQLVKSGNALFSEGKYDDAIRRYDEAAVDDPESPVIYFNKGTAFYKKAEYGNAINAFQQAAVKTKDIALETKSKFNLGLCFFREGERQKDSDLKKAIESYEASVRSFQEALALDPTFTEAAENIEMVRLMIKALLDEIKKQEEAAKKQQQQNQETAEQIKRLIEKQKNLLAENKSLINDKPENETPNVSGQKPPEQNTQQIHDIEEAQKRLQKETEDLSEQLANQVPAPGAIPPATSSAQGVSPAPEHPSKPYLDASAKEQHDAVERFSEKNAGAAADNQQQSLDHLNKALEALTSGQQNPQEGQQQQQQGGQQDSQQTQGNENQQGDKNEQIQDSRPSDEALQQPEKNQQQMQAVQLTDDANNIIDDEKENKKQRMPFSSGDFKNVDKDW